MFLIGGVSPWSKRYLLEGNYVLEEVDQALQGTFSLECGGVSLIILHRG